MLSPISTSSSAATQFAAFSATVAAYAAATAGNVLLVAVIARDRGLRCRPMYALIGALALTDVAASSAVLPRLLANVAAGGAAVVSLAECVAQMAFVHLSIRTQGYVLALMAVDRYVAIVHPLRYGALVSVRGALASTAAAALASAAMVAANVATVARLGYRCRGGNGSGAASLVIRAPFCDFMSIASMSCGGNDLGAHAALSYAITALTVALPALAIAAAYALVLVECRRPGLRSAGIGKAVRTCGTHLIVVAIFYAAILLSLANGVAFGASAQGARSAVQALLCTAPFVLNPVVYGVRMERIKRGALRLCGARGRAFQTAAEAAAASESDREML
uniref:Olfactory receptor 1L6-like n=1 Tax=Petromyzon marinus TaxID=7757 RepID=A0AAJ7UGV2_PETMA|nr:olfactory receptor 1L6-like [Petromyzon marinus]